MLVVIMIKIMKVEWKLIIIYTEIMETVLQTYIKVSFSQTVIKLITVIKINHHYTYDIKEYQQF